jgi:hypothetical protein
MLSNDPQRTEASISNVLEPVQLKLILKSVDDPYAQSANQAGMVAKNSRANMETLSRFSAGISVSFPEGQKEIFLNYHDVNSSYGTLAS